METCSIKNLSGHQCRNSKAPHVGFTQQFQDIGSFSSAIGWELDFRQLDKGRLELDVLGIQGRDFTLLGLNLNRSFHQIGAPPKDMFALAIPFLDTPEFRWCSGTSQGGSLLNFNLHNNFDAITPAYGAAVISIDADHLQNFADEAGFHGNLRDILKSRTNWRNKHSISLARGIQSLTWEVRSGAVSVNAYLDYLNENLLKELMQILMDGVPVSTVISDEYMHRVFKRALEFINDSDHPPVKVSEVCKEVRCSPATLWRAFMFETGISPKTYIMNRRLSAVRDALHPAKNDQSVTDVANQWGFWHMGQFAKDYRLMFEELPSDSLRNSG